MYFGLPNGLMVALDALAFTGFTFIVGRFGEAELAATNITFTLNIVVILPVLGIGQAVEVLVGRRLGEERPDLAERSTWTGFLLAWAVMAVVAVTYVTVPDLLLLPFRNAADPAAGAAADVARVLLRFVAAYCLFDSANLVFSFALRGAGDTRFVTLGGPRPGMARYGAADVAGVPLPVGAVLGVGLRQRVHRLAGGDLFRPVPPRELEDDARHRASRRLAASVRRTSSGLPEARR